MEWNSDDSRATKRRGIVVNNVEDRPSGVPKTNRFDFFCPWWRVAYGHFRNMARVRDAGANAATSISIPKRLLVSWNRLRSGALNA